MRMVSQEPEGYILIDRGSRRTARMGAGQGEGLTRVQPCLDCGGLHCFENSFENKQNRISGRRAMWDLRCDVPVGRSAQGGGIGSH